MAAWHRDWTTAVGTSKGKIWPFTYEEMQARGRATVLTKALQKLEVKQQAPWKGSYARLVNQTDAGCDA